MRLEQAVIPPVSDESLRQKIRAYYLKDESQVVEDLIAEAGLQEQERSDISAMAADLVSRVRASSNPSMMENFLAEYGLTTKEGVALMCLAEALLRVPDAQTIDELIEDKISPGNWGQHLGHSGSSLVNASTWALLLTGKVVAPEDQQGLRVVDRRHLVGRLNALEHRIDDEEREQSYSQVNQEPQTLAAQPAQEREPGQTERDGDHADKDPEHGET
jgi:proline dehydrogenase